ncbi:MFS transporter [Nocardioides sp. NPDC006303]|uniref:MFS transporter n=1 Tax=Nocardioides sp. NPDC006303 TaxID=3156747 RepID=UPI0033B8ECD0
MTHPKSRPRPMGRIAFASLIGTTVEFYDFFIFGTAAALVFGATFFPALGPAGGTLASLATFGVAFVARPFGSAFFGHFGDRLGRKVTLISTLMLMGGSTVAIGLLPTAATIGAAAPILLVLLRILQGIALGGEWAGAVLLAGEHAPSEKRGFYTMFPQLGPGIGLALALGTFLATGLTMSNEAFVSWGWRIPFLASVVMVAIGLFVRLKIAETPNFEKLKSANHVAKAPVWEVIRNKPVQLLAGAGSLAMAFAMFHTGATWLIGYGPTALGLSRSTVLSLGVLGALAFAAMVLVGGALSDRRGRRFVIMSAALVSIPWSLVLLPIVGTGAPLAFAVAVIVTLGISGYAYGPVGAQLPELFPTRYRYTGAGIAYSLSGVVGGALPPLIAEALIPRFGTQAVGYYLVCYGLITVGSLLVLRLETKAIDFDALETTEPEGAAQA